MTGQAMSIEFHQLFLFAIAFSVMVVSPGPFVAAIAARSAAFGFRNGFMMALGASLAECVYVLLAVFGLAALAATHEWALEILRYIGAGWLIWLGFTLLTSRASIVKAEGGPPLHDSSARAFWVGALINLGNPKAALFYMVLFPGFFDMAALGLADAIAILMVTLPLGLVFDCGYAFAGAKARLLFKNERAIQRANRATGGVMVGAGLAIAAH